MEQAELVRILRRVIESPPASYNEANDLEAKLLAIDRDVPQIEEFMYALATFEPTDHPSTYMSGFDGLRSAAREALHDFDIHEDCAHNTPLGDRP